MNQQKNNNADGEKLRIIPLGGTESIGMNCTLVEYNNHIIIIDAGMGFSDFDHLGVDYLIPNYDYLWKKKNNIEGIFITHGHLDHIGAIHHFLRELDYPEIFAPRFAMELIKLRLKEEGILDKAKLIEVDNTSILDNGKVQVQYFRVNHSIPDSYGIIVKTPVGNVVHSGDFKFDYSPLNEPTADFHKMSGLGKEGVRVLLSDSTNSYREGHSISEMKIMEGLDSIVQNAKGRIIVATFASLVTRLYALVEIAKKYDRKIYVSGRSMANSVGIARKLGYIEADDKLFVDDKHLNRFNPERILVLATGSQGESMAALSRMARGEHKTIKIQKNDTVIFSSSVIPGNDMLVENLTDMISRLGADIINNDIMNVHTSGHGFIEDQKLMINLFKPELFMPVHGNQYYIKKHADTAGKLGVPEKNHLIPEDGQAFEIGKRSWKKAERVKHHPLLVSGSGVGDVGPLVLQDREKLGANGVLVISLLLRKKGKSGSKSQYEIVGNPSIYSRGFVYVRDSGELMQQINDKIKQVFSKKNTLAIKELRSKLRSEIEYHVGGLIYNMLERDPLIATNIEIIPD